MITRVERGRRCATAFAAGLAVACGGEPAGAEPDRPGVYAVDYADAPRADTVQAVPRRPVTVRVVDALGRPAVGVVVRFAVLVAPDSVPTWRLTFRRQDGEAAPLLFAADTTDAEGRAEVHVQLGETAGAGGLVVTVPTLGYRDTLTYTVTPGAPAGVRVTPRDSALYVGRRYALRARVVDRFGNPRPDLVTLRAASNRVSVQATPTGGEVTGVSLGRGAVIASGAGREDTAYVSVVPEGVLAVRAYNYGDASNRSERELTLMQLDGSAVTPLAFPPGYRSDPLARGVAWMPGGARLLLARANAVNLTSVAPPGGSESAVVDLDAPIVGGARPTRDGRWVYFGYRGTRSQPAGLHRVHVDGTGFERLWRDTTAVAPFNIGSDRDPSPSPDGALVAYISERSPCGVDTCVRVWDVAAARDRRFGDVDFLVRGTHAAWSPVDARIAVATQTSIVLARPDGGAPRTLADGFRFVQWIDWSPDGRWLVVSSLPLQRPVTLIDTETGEVLPLAFLTLTPRGEVAWRQ